jgi:CheY-like chemotaxis protein
MSAEIIPDTSTLLRDGISAARNGDKARARELLRLVTTWDEGSEIAWLWLASLAETMAERVQCLKRVLVINPLNQQAITILGKTRSAPAPVNNLLEKAINAAKAGDRGIATQMFLEASEHEPQNETVWLWLASITESAEDKLAYLQRVLAINPAHERATQMFSRTKTLMARQLLKKGIAAYQRKDRQEARAILADVMEYDQNLEEGWLLMAYLTDSVQEKMSHLERVLSINPANQHARSSLERAQAQLAGPVTPTVPAAPVKPHTPAAPIKLTPPAAPVTVTAAAVTKLESKSEPAKAELPATWKCPLCLTEASAAIDTCPACGAQVTLHDLDRLLSNDKANQAVMQAALGRLRVALDGEPTARDLFNVGIALMNSKETDEGIAYLEAASRLDPKDENLGMKVRELIGRRAGKAARVVESEPVARDEVVAHQRPELEQREHKTQNQKVVPAKTVLIVDDSSTVRKLVEIKLRNRGYQVIAAVDGVDGLAKLSEQLPDLILLDVTMPRLDGYQLCKHVKSNKDTKHIPVVMLSGKDGFFDKVRGRVAGSTAYITKPFDPETLISAVEEYCGPAVSGAKG